MATQTHDDGFHEIQLNGKQLVFLFMAVTVAGVAIFFFGMMVGRGVRVARAEAVEAQEVEQSPIADTAARVAPPPDAAEDVRVNPTTPPPSPVDEADAPKDGTARDAAPKDGAPKPADAPAAPVAAAAKPVAPPAQTAEQKRPAAAAPAPTSNPVPPPASAPVVASNATSGAAAPATTAPGSGYTVQVAALNVRSEADAIAKRLNSKGYAAYVQSPPGSTNVYRVRVGGYKTRREAETVATKLQKEEQFKPWVTR